MSIQLLLTPEQAAEQRARSALSKARKTTAIATNQALLRALGITQPNVVALQLSMHPRQPPTVTLDCLIDAAALEHEASHFELVLREEPKPTPEPRPALDLDALCAAARQRVANTVALASGIAIGKQLAESKQIRQQLRYACDRYSADAKRAIGVIDLAPAINDWFRDFATNYSGATTLGGLVSPGLTKALADFPRFNHISFDFGRENK